VGGLQGLKDRKGNSHYNVIGKITELEGALQMLARDRRNRKENVSRAHCPQLLCLCTENPTCPIKILHFGDCKNVMLQL